MPQSLDVAPSSSFPTEEGICVPDPPPPKVAEHLTGRLSSCQLSALCLLNKQYCHAGCDSTHASLSIQRTFESPTSDQDALFSALYGPNTPFRSNCAQFEEEEVSDPEPAARGPGAGQPVHICVHTQQQDVSLITQAPRRGGKRKAEDIDDSSDPSSRVSRPRAENDENVLSSVKGAQDYAQDDHNSFLSFCDEDTKLVSPFQVDGVPIHREDSEWSISTDVSLDDSAARMPLGCLYTDESLTASHAPALPGLDDESSEGEDDDVYTDFDPYRFMKYLPPLNLVVPDARSPVLPPKAPGCGKMTLVLDLDETLVHSSLNGGSSPDFSFLVDFNNQQHAVNVKQRPYLFDFLERAAALFEVVIFTASQQVYAEQLLDILDPEGKLILHRIYRDGCVYVDGNYLKDLTVLGRDLERTVIVDNSPHAFGFQICNGIPIESWYDDENDRELQLLMPFLEKLSSEGDVRPLIADTYKMQQLVAMADEPANQPAL